MDKNIRSSRKISKSIDYDSNCENLVNYIQNNYKESELIDFEEDKIRHWKFLAKNIVLSG